MMRLTWSELKTIIVESFDQELYDEQLDAVIKRYAALGTYVRFDDTKAFSLARSFSNDNPNAHNNHAGLWTYMIEPGSGWNGEAPFALGGKWVTIIKTRNPSRMLRTDAYSDSDLKNDLLLVGKAFGVDGEKIINDYVKERSDNHAERMSDPSIMDDPELLALYQELNSHELSPFEKLDTIATRWNVGTRKRNLRQDLRTFYLKLGYVGIEDPMGYIDTNGWTAVHFDPHQVTILKRFKFEHAHELGDV